MEDQEVPVVTHDDGIFNFKKKLEFGQTSVAEFAWEVINCYKEKEMKRIGRLKGPVTKVGGVPKQIVMESMRQTAGVISYAPAQLYCFSTKEEHQNAKRLNSFFMHAEPVYESRSAAAKHHEQYCWRIALLNAYRILDLTQDTSVIFPTGWIHLDVTPQKKNYSGLLASAAYQMGLYYAKAQAMPKATAAIRGKSMSEAKKGRYTELGKLIYSACKEIERREGGLPKRNVSGKVMAILEEWGKASTKGALWHVSVAGKNEWIDSRKISKFLTRYRDRSE